MQKFLNEGLIPSLKRGGAKTVGLFNSSIAPDSPFSLMVVEYPSISVFESAWDAIMQDPEMEAPAGTLLSNPAIPFERLEVSLFRSFQGFPKIEIPPAPETGKPPRVFELRTYESNTPVSLRRKIGMFEDGEIDIFRKSGLTPVFFGQALAGRKIPNLTYMLCHESLAAREANWRTFVTSPEWKKLAATPGLSDGEVVSNISTVLLSPAAGSMIR
jgi:hypothetical protein